MAITWTNSAPVSGGTILHTDISQMRTDIENKFAGNIVDADISASANIGVSKLAASYEHCVVQCTYSGPISGGWPGSGVVCFGELPDDSKGAWVATHATWGITDTGDGLGAFRVQWGHYNGATWTSIANVGDIVTMANSAGANDANDGSVAGISSVTLTAGTAMRLAVIATTGSATTMTADPGYFAVGVHCRRQITSA